MPTISAIIPTYNRAHFLGEALRSVQIQTRPVDEIVVVDDGSTDDTEQVIARCDAPIRYIRQKNSGPAAARNHGFRVAVGDYLALLDSDDLWVPDRLERQCGVLAAQPSLDFLSGLEAKFSSQALAVPCHSPDPVVGQTLDRTDGVLADPVALLVRDNYIPTSTVLFRKSCLGQTGLLDDSLHQAEDYDFWFRFAIRDFRFGFVNAVLCHRRQHEGNLVSQWANRTLATATVLSRYRDAVPDHASGIAERLNAIYYDLGSYYLYRREYREAVRYLNQSRTPGIKRIVCAFKITAARLLEKASCNRVARS